MLTIIIPVYNEVKTIGIIIKKIMKIKNLKKKIIIVDDKSTDGTTEYLKKKQFNNKKIFKIIFHKKNMGKGAAIQTAQRYANEKYTIIQDADLEYDPRDYNKIINILIKKKSKVVYGSRVLGINRYLESKSTSVIRIFANHALTVISNLINKQKLTDAHTCYKAFETKFFKKIKLEENGFNFCPEITTKISNQNIEIKEIKVRYYPRSFKQGKKIKYSDGFKALWTLIKYKYIKNKSL